VKRLTGWQHVKQQRNLIVDPVSIFLTNMKGFLDLILCAGALLPMVKITWKITKG
jgi:hypothetical protein